jgi:hypothetical protein
MRLLKRSLPLILAVPLVLTTGTAFAAEEDTCARGGGGQECQGPISNGGDGLPGPGPGIL